MKVKDLIYLLQTRATPEQEIDLHLPWRENEKGSERPFEFVVVDLEASFSFVKECEYDDDFISFMLPIELGKRLIADYEIDKTCNEEEPEELPPYKPTMRM